MSFGKANSLGWVAYVLYRVSSLTRMWIFSRKMLLICREVGSRTGVKTVTRGAGMIEKSDLATGYFRLKDDSIDQYAYRR